MPRRVAIIGAGMGGLAAAMDLAGAGCEVHVFERAGAPGGKARRLLPTRANSSPHPWSPQPSPNTEREGIDAGPTVFTYREVFERLFADAGCRLEDEVSLYATPVLARHFWREGGQLDLMVDRRESAARIGEFAGSKAARQYQQFCQESAALYDALRDSFMCRPLPSPAGFMLQLLRDQQRLRHLASMWRAPPWQSLWQALHQRFDDPRLQQLFARYSTYVGSSPLSAPATLMLIAHVEQEGVWLIRGGMQALGAAMARASERRGAQYHYNTHVSRLIVERSRIVGIVLADGQRADFDTVIFNGDAQALASGLLGEQARTATPRRPHAQRGLSAITWCRHATLTGRTPAYHNVFFAEDYPREFHDIFEHRQVTDWPTVYLCAQDRGTDVAVTGAERMLLLANAPADGDFGGISDDTLRGIEDRVIRLLADCGLTLGQGPTVVTRPQEFAELFPGSGGSLYGEANHGAFASFARPSAQTRIRGLWLAGGSAHPGPGVPMATLSGRIAAAECLAAAD